MMSEAKLVVMRLVDMARVHPDQDNSRACSECGQMVGIYPSGQRALREHPEMTIICARCAAFEHRPSDIDLPAGSMDEIIEEMRMSREVPKA